LYKQAENGNLKNILSLEDQPLVSVDFIGRTESAVLAEDLCQVNRHQLRLYGW
ncbi:MAG TPA: type I glyceraldehyde-3-phosphate dehydrogenase, partial [Gammaproteobacteria bacterium]|nr:type I glyceraldehyde-3-phosphate dehydrogenase [Gammaproteobacteria bacterium]